MTIRMLVILRYPINNLTLVSDVFSLKIRVTFTVTIVEKTQFILQSNLILRY